MNLPSNRAAQIEARRDYAPHQWVSISIQNRWLHWHPLQPHRANCDTNHTREPALHAITWRSSRAALLSLSSLPRVGC